jgi:hypothetical protein
MKDVLSESTAAKYFPAGCGLGHVE